MHNINNQVRKNAAQENCRNSAEDSPSLTLDTCCKRSYSRIRECNSLRISDTVSLPPDTPRARAAEQPITFVRYHNRTETTRSFVQMSSTKPTHQGMGPLGILRAAAIFPVISPRTAPAIRCKLIIAVPRVKRKRQVSELVGNFSRENVSKYRRYSVSCRMCCWPQHDLDALCPKLVKYLLPCCKQPPKLLLIKCRTPQAD